MSMLLDIMSWFCLLTGLFFSLTGVIGTLRFPDFYTRVHASSVTETLGAALLILGLALQAGFTLVSVKLLFIFVFLWYTSPAAGHALVRAAHHMGLPAYRLSPKHGNSVQPVDVRPATEENTSSKR